MKRFIGLLRQMGLLMVGQPSYQIYLEHMAERHPDVKPMNKVEFFREREHARYGRKGPGRCC